MVKIIDGKRYYLYTQLPPESKRIYQYRIYKFLFRLIFEYYGFRRWYWGLYTDGAELKCSREIIICESRSKIAGIAVIKNDPNEKKICTLRVAQNYQHQGIGSSLVEMCMQQMHTSSPMITLHKNKFKQFKSLLDSYNFELKQVQKHYYSIFSTELVFNGQLPEKRHLKL